MSGAAASAGLPGAAVDPVRCAAPPIAGGDLVGALEFARISCWARSTSRARSTSPTGRPGCRPDRNAGSRGVEVADAGEVALVEQRLDRSARRVGHAAGGRPRQRPVAAEQVGPEMSDDGLPRRRAATTSTMPSRKPDRSATSALREHEPCLEGRRPPPRRRPVDVPGALHLQMGVEGDVGEPGQQVLAAADGLVDRLADEVERRASEGPGSRTRSAAGRSAPGRAVAPCARRCRPQASARQLASLGAVAARAAWRGSRPPRAPPTAASRGCARRRPARRSACRGLRRARPARARRRRAGCAPGPG